MLKMRDDEGKGRCFILLVVEGMKRRNKQELKKASIVIISHASEVQDVAGLECRLGSLPRHYCSPANDHEGKDRGMRIIKDG